MAQERISMRIIKDVLRLHAQGISQVGIARALQIGRGTVQEYLRRLHASGIPLREAEALSNAALETALFPPSTPQQRDDIPRFAEIFEELRKPHATLLVLWEEYKQAHPAGYSYTHFCELVRRERKKLHCSMRQTHTGGEKTFVDFGEGPRITDATTGVVMKTRLFVSVWGASSYLYAQVVPEESLEYWIKANRAAFEFYGCCPAAIVPDNLKAAVTTACRYEPRINATFLEFARHYNTTILPARPHKPKDKAKVENAVGLVQRWIVFRLRNHCFHTIAEAQAKVLELVEQVNNRPMKQWGKSRRELFETLDKVHAQSLPDRPYEYAVWKHATVQFNYHVHFDGHDYSVPHHYIHVPVEIRATTMMVEIFYRNTCIAQHLRSDQKHAATTVAEHMPVAHQRYAEWTPERIMMWAEKYGPRVKELVTHVLNSRRHPEQAFKSCLGIIRLGTKFPHRLNDACQRALAYRAYAYRSVRTILEKGLTAEKEQPALQSLHHANVRGAAYYLPGLDAASPARQTTSISISTGDPHVYSHS